MARISRRQRQLFDEGAFEFRLENSRELLTPADEFGMVTLESAVHAAFILTLRTAVKAQGTLYRRQVKQIQGMLRDMIGAKVVEKGVLKGLKRLISAQGRKLFGALMKQATAVLDYWKSAKANLDLEEAVRNPGLITMLDLTQARLRGKRHRKKEMIFSRMKKAPEAIRKRSGPDVVEGTQVPASEMMNRIRKVAEHIEGRTFASNREFADYIATPANARKLRKGFDKAAAELWPEK